MLEVLYFLLFFFFQAEDGIRDTSVTGVQTCALPILHPPSICPVDWELAAIGSSFYDLAFLADGFEPPRLDQVLEAYRAEALRGGIEEIGRASCRERVEIGGGGGAWREKGKGERGGGR